METTNYQVRILHNEGRGHFFGYDPDTADLYLVHTYEVERQSNGRPEPKNVAAQAFHTFNVGDDPSFGTPQPEAVAYRAKRLRSLSEGDVVLVIDPDENRTFLACAKFGWDEVPEADQRDAAPLEANPMYVAAHREESTTSGG